MGWLDRLLSPWQAPALPQVEPAAPAQVAQRRHRWDGASFVNLATGLGATGTRGVASQPNVAFTRLNDVYSEVLYRSNAYARRFIDIMPMYETRKGWRLVDGSDDPRPMEEADRRLKVRQAIRQARVWARITGGSMIVMVTDEAGVSPEDARTGRWLARPMDASQVVSVRSLLVLSSREVSPNGWVTDISDPDYGEPSAWRVAPYAPGGGQWSGAVIHRSRCLRFFGADLPPMDRYERDSWGDSVLQPVLEALRHVADGDNILAEVLSEIKTTVLKTAGTMGEVGDEAEAIGARMKALTLNRSALSTVVLAPDEDFINTAAPVTGAADISDRLRQAWSAATGIPMYRLFGQSANGLNANDASAQDGFYEDVSASQEDNLREPLERLYAVIYASKQGPTRGQVPESWRLEFAPLDEPTEAQRVDQRSKEAAIDWGYLDRGVLMPGQVADARFGADGWQDIQPAQDEALGDLDALLAQVAAEVKGGEAGQVVPKTDADDSLVRATLADLRAAIDAGQDVTDLLEDLSDLLGEG